MNELERAYKWADYLHFGQVRKYTGEPYVNHCREVVETLRLHEINEESVLVAAMLHDVVEDTNATIGDVSKNFGTTVSRLVSFLTDASKPADGNREARKEIDRKHLLSSPYDAVLLIKCADLISNTASIVERDPNFAKTYLKEKAMLLEAMKSRVGEHSLWKTAMAITEEGVAA